jgi:predicted RNA binding protein YcfA (HicA-like mRNA interferase family)
MSPKLPQVSGNDLIRLLKELGYEVVRQKGSHIRLRKTTPAGEHKITVPNHKEISKGTLNEILSDVSLWSGVSKDELIGRL